MAAHNDVSWFRGEDILLKFTMTPVTDISAWTISAKIKASVADAAPLLTIGVSIISGPAGTFSVAVNAAQNTTTLTAGAYVYSVTRTDTGSVAVLSEGVILVKPSAQLA